MISLENKKFNRSLYRNLSLAAIGVLVFFLFLAFSLTAGARAKEETMEEKVGDDVSTRTKETVDRLSALSLVDDSIEKLDLQGYITREELNSIIDKIVEKSDLNKTRLQEIETGSWRSGWVEVAPKFYKFLDKPAEDFPPEKEVTYQEVITVLLNLLGYYDLPGNWPANYLDKGEQLGLMDDILVDPKSKASRADVLFILNKTLEKKPVEWNDEESKFRALDDNPLLLRLIEDKDKVTGRVIENFRIDESLDKNEVRIKKDTRESAEKVYSLKTSGEYTPGELLGLEVEAVTGDDNIYQLQIFTGEDQVVHKMICKDRPIGKYQEDYIAFWGEDTRYAVDENVKSYINYEKRELESRVLHYGRFVFENDTIVYVSVIDFSDNLQGNVITDVLRDEAKIKTWYKDGKELEINLNEYEKVHFFDREFNNVDLGAIFPGKMIYGFEDKNNEELYLIVTGESYVGELTSVFRSYVNFEGKSYDLIEGYTTIFNEEYDKEYNGIELYEWLENYKDVRNLRGEKVEILLDINNEIKNLQKLKEEEKTWHYGVLTGAYKGRPHSSVAYRVWEGLGDNEKVFEILTSDGEVQAKLAGSESEWALFGQEKKGLFESESWTGYYLPVKYELKDDFTIAEDSIEVIVPEEKSGDYKGVDLEARGLDLYEKHPVNTMDNMELGGDLYYIMQDNDYHYISRDTILMKYEQAGDGSNINPATLSWDNIGYSEAGNVEAYVVGDAGEIARFVVFHNRVSQLVGEKLYGVVADSPRSIDGKLHVEVKVAGKGLREYKVRTRDVVSYGDVIKFNVYENNEIELLKRYGEDLDDKSFEDKYKNIAVGGIVGDYIELKPTGEGGSTSWYELLEDSLILDGRDEDFDEPIERSDLEKGDKVVSLEKEGKVKVIMIIERD